MPIGGGSFVVFTLIRKAPKELSLSHWLLTNNVRLFEITKFLNNGVI